MRNGGMWDDESIVTDEYNEDWDDYDDRVCSYPCTHCGEEELEDADLEPGDEPQSERGSCSS